MTRLSVFCGGDERFFRWMKEVDRLCQRFLNCEYLGLVGSGDATLSEFSPQDFYEEGMSAEVYFSTVVVGELKGENGDLIDHVVAENAIWGRLPWVD